MDPTGPQNVLPYERVPAHRPVASFPTPGEASMAASRLESEDIDCQVLQHAVLEGITSRGATLVVEEEHFERAVQVLSTTPARRCLLVNPVLPAGETEAAPRPALLGRLLGWWGRQWRERA